MDSGPRHVVIGPGGIGGGIAVGLYSTGREVEVVARGAHLAAIREHGLTRHAPDATITANVVAHASVDEVSWRENDVAIIATKVHQAAAVLDALLGAAPPTVLVVCAQNGLDGERQALRRFSHVAGMLVNMPATHLEPGVVELYAAAPGALLDVGPVAGAAPATMQRCEQLARDLTAAGFLSEATARIMDRKASKLLGNLGNAVQVICGHDIEIGDAAVLDLAHAEGVAALAAAGIVVDPAQRTRQAMVGRGDIAGRARTGGSSWQSAVRGTGDVESSFLNGEIVLLGRMHGVATPVNALLQRLAVAQAGAAAGPGTMAITDLDLAAREAADAGT